MIKEENTHAQTFFVGFADVIITPESSMPLGGYGASSLRKHENVLEDLHVISTAMTLTYGYANGHWYYIPSRYGYDYS